MVNNGTAFAHVMNNPCLKNFWNFIVSKHLYLPLISIIYLMGINDLYAAKLYQWADTDGVLNFSPEPPPANVTKQFKEISGNFQTGISHFNKKPAMNSQNNSEYIDTSIDRSNAKRLVPAINLSHPSSMQAIQFDVSEENKYSKPISHDFVREQRKCRDLGNKIIALEARITRIEGIEQLNKTMVMLSQHQQRFDQHCRQYR